jgi:hypothetical protein
MVFMFRLIVGQAGPLAVLLAFCPDSWLPTDPDLCVAPVTLLK